jgi:hypothetical protein
MEHAANFIADLSIPPRLPRGFAAGTLLETDEGPRDVAELQPGDVLRDAVGRGRRITSLDVSADTDLWVAMPSGAPGSPLRVGAGQILACRHFICAALFGTREALFTAGNMTGPRVRPSQGERRRFFLPVAEGALVLSVGGYEFPCVPSVSPGRWGECRASGNTTHDGGGPHSRQGGAPLARALLSADQTLQLCDSGVLFRHGGRE